MNTEHIYQLKQLALAIISAPLVKAVSIANPKDAATATTP